MVGQESLVSFRGTRNMKFELAMQTLSIPANHFAIQLT
jgi:hypothetical protein